MQEGTEVGARVAEGWNFSATFQRQDIANSPSRILVMELFKGYGLKEKKSFLVGWEELISDAYGSGEKEGIPKAQFVLGWLYDKGLLLEQSYKKAADWYLKAAESGYAPAQYCVASMYDDAKIGTARDRDKAFEWYFKAAEQGYSNAQYNLSCLYDEDQDARQSVEWLHKAALQGDDLALLFLGEDYMEGDGVVADSAKAASWLSKSAAQGNYAASELLDSLFLD